LRSALGGDFFWPLSCFFLLPSPLSLRYIFTGRFFLIGAFSCVISPCLSTSRFLALQRVLARYPGIVPPPPFPPRSTPPGAVSLPSWNTPPSFKLFYANRTWFRIAWQASFPRTIFLAFSLPPERRLFLSSPLFQFRDLLIAES